MKIYYCWITMLLPSYQDIIITSLIKKNYLMGSTSKSGKLTSEDKDSASSILSISIYHRENAKDCNQLFQDISDIMAENKLYYFSIIVSEATDCVWSHGNIVLPKDEIYID